MNRRHLLLLCALTAMFAVGCSGPDAAVSPTPSPPAASPSAAPITPMAPTGSAASPSSEPSGPPQAPPPAPTAPAPSTAGNLTADDIPLPEGWQPTARPGSTEEGYLGNGTWVHATSPQHSALGAITLGCAEPGPYPQPVAALEGTLVDGAGSPGVGLALEFATPDDARGFFDEWVTQAKACAGTATTPVSLDDDTWLGRRNLGTVWSEAVGVRGVRVILLIVDSPDARLEGVIPPA